MQTILTMGTIARKGGTTQTVYLENKLQLISINFTPKTSNPVA